MAALPQTIPPLASPSIASYNWTDVASGLGFVDFFPRDSILQTKALHVQGEQAAGTTSYSAAKTFTSSAFNSPRYVQGDAVFQVYTSGVAGGNNIKCQVFHVDAANNESSISSEVQADLSTVDGWIMIPGITITQTHFKIGEKLRIKLTPSTGITVTISSESPLISIPFKINL